MDVVFIWIFDLQTVVSRMWWIPYPYFPLLIHSHTFSFIKRQKLLCSRQQNADDDDDGDFLFFSGHVSSGIKIFTSLKQWIIMESQREFSERKREKERTMKCGRNHVHPSQVSSDVCLTFAVSQLVMLIRDEDRDQHRWRGKRGWEIIKISCMIKLHRNVWCTSVQKFPGEENTG